MDLLTHEYNYWAVKSMNWVLLGKPVRRNRLPCRLDCPPDFFCRQGHLQMVDAER